jgi:hypothetical protein
MIVRGVRVMNDLINEKNLTAEYEAYLAERPHLAKVSADELSFELQDEVNWLVDFVERWEESV